MNKVVLITGGSSGIGKSIGEFLHQKGFVVYGTSRNPEKVLNSVFPLVALDVRNSDSIQKAVSKIIETSGRLDIVINNAGVGITGPLEEIPTEEIRNNFETNFFGPIEVMKAALPQMRKQNSGLIINITSIAGYMGLPYRSVYSASKGALELITEALRMEVKSFGIEITNVAPGDFATNIAAGRYHAPVIKDSAYEKVYGEVLATMNDHVDAGSNPNEMAEAVYKIIQTKKPNVHYKVGAFMQKFSIVLKRALPDKMYEKMLMNHYKL
ncbi:short-chain dehydrogenase [Flavobacterium sp. Root935]|jgi:NAD(P)-dependent dehydrogenase (short-subunit alcohol dehydrogenase family)|uniref:SDR family oxidoreductase n=1 Tax=unclassified Flavobacterium TaxID=196869 RepID=UPI00070E4B61|nr:MULTISPECIES: SDR family oxidoreductase [unclassified Flavobacterium]KRD61469.1 short-chain dehydrogenase [Flavobacterium sp. Root935]MDQ1166678.1 NAD(P)-dependent dehydrogenase (short-subunit alcohol dehydrogenase family) [Flavobacterium sp. SORGH_AS_0622]TDX12664.1 short-subunit dehydrogenase [Flavobacterium sp. S87F.05.LMB.W.Kidney.N]